MGAGRGKGSVRRVVVLKILGIDPGLSGALAWLDDSGELEIHGMPIHQITVNGKKKRKLDLYQLGVLIDSMANETKIAVIEDVSAMPKQGVTSSFNFGFSAGVIQGVVAANLIPMQLVRPAVWKKSMGLTRDKDSSRQKASAMYPKFCSHWSLKKDADKAEAALIATYGSNHEPRVSTRHS